MASKGETVKYVIDADVSEFIRGMLEASAAADVGGKSIDKSLTTTKKSTENNFRDIQSSTKKTAQSIRSFTTAFEGFNATSLILGVSALSGVVLELSGALAAAGSTVSILFPALLDGGAAVATFKTGLSGLSAAFKAIQKNDPKAFKDSLVNLGPAATSVAYALGGLNKAFNSVKLNTQNALLAGIGNTLLTVGGQVLPTVNAGFQQIGQAINGALKEAGNLAGSSLFSGLLATIFADTAHNVTILSGALQPLLTIFTNLYLITRPYVSLLAQEFVNLTKNVASYLSSAKGQVGLTLAIQEGIVAVQQLAHFVGAAFGLLVAIFRTSALSGVSLITTLTGIIKQTEAWVNSAKGQQDLNSLFNFTSLALKDVARSVGIAAQVFFGLLNILNSLSPTVQSIVIDFLSFATAIGPIGGYFLKLFGAFKTVALVAFNLAEQLVVVFGALGAVASIALVLAGGLIILGAIIKGPLGSALIVIGSLLIAYIGLNYLLAGASATAAAGVFELGFAAIGTAAEEADLAGFSVLAASTMYAVAAAGLEAGEGLIAGATGAELLQAALLPLLLLAAGILVILGMLGVFSNKGKQATSASAGLSGSLGALQKSLKGVGTAGAKASGAGLSPLSDSLNNVGDAATAASGSLASFDKMNVLTDNSAAGAGIPGLPSIPDIGAGSVGAPTLDTGDFDKALAGMEKNFDGFKTNLGKGIPNPFASIGDWIDKHPWIALAAFVVILAAIAIAFIVLDVAALPITLTLGLIVLAVIAIIAIIILLVQNWSTVWGFITSVVSVFWGWIESVFTDIFNFIGGVLSAIGDFFKNIFSIIATVVQTYIDIYIAIFQFLWAGIVLIFSVAVAFFQAIWDGIKAGASLLWDGLKAGFSLIWQGIVAIWNVAIGFFQGIWNGITGAFSAVATFFSKVFSDAWSAVKTAFSAVSSFFSGIWTDIKNVFTTIGSTIGGAVEDAFKTVINGVLGAAQTVINAPINTIDSLIKKINSIPGIPNIPTIPNVTLPRLAKGGIINSPTTAIIGEAGAEAIMPLENNTGWITQLAEKINAANGNSSQQPLNLTVQIGEDRVANKIIDLINEKTQMSGRNTILV